MPQSVTNIRTATLDDAEAIAIVHVESWRTAHQGLMPADFLDGLSEEQRTENGVSILTKDAPREFNLVAEHEDEIVGFASGGPERKNDPDFSGELYALDQFRRRGIGADLLEKTFELLLSLGMESMKVWVLKDSPFRAFYEKHGGILLADEETIRIGDLDLIHIAYGWPP